MDPGTQINQQPKGEHMKESIRRWLGLAIVPLTLLMLGASPAFAQNETHKCDGDPAFPFLNEVFTHDENNPENGSIIVRRTDGLDCVISASDIHATGQIDIRVEGGGRLIIPDAVNVRSLGGNVTLVSTGNDISAPNADVKADNLIDIQAGVADGTVTGSIETQDIISNYRDVLVGDANILIRAQSGLNVGKVKTNGDLGVNSQRSGNVQIDANLHPSNNGDISIGAGGNIEEIDIRSQTGGTDQNGNPSPFKAEIGLRVENGSDNSTGNITVSDLGVIKVTQAQSRSGRLELNTNKGELILGSGTLDASQADFGGGNIYLFGEKITFSGAATIDNGQSDTAPKTARQIIIAASEIDYSAGNLEIFSDGSGLSDAAPATVYFLPAGGIISTSTNNVLSLEHTVQFNGSFFFFPGEVHFNGGAGSDLDLRADGEHIQVAITGDNIVFDGKDVTVQARGKNHTKHEIVMGFFDFGSYDGTKGLQMNNTGVTLFNVRGFGGPNNSGGDIQIQVDKSDLNLSRWNLRAQGGANVGDGGTVLYTTSQLTLSSDTLLDFKADAAANGIGDAQVVRPTNGRKAIFLNAGSSELLLGKGKEKIQFSAKGGGTGGNGGAIEIIAGDTITLRNHFGTIDASAQADDGNGGEVKLFSSDKVVFIPGSDPIMDPTLSSILATGGKDGDGGFVEINSAPNFDVIAHTKASPVDNGAIPAIVATTRQLNGSQKGGDWKINNVQCREVANPNADGDWPETYWNCANPQNPQALDQEPSFAITNFLTPALRGSTGSSKIKLYVFNSITDHNTHFQRSDDDLAGITWESDNIYASVWKTIPGSSTTWSTPTFRSVSVHESGHGFDHLFKQDKQSASARYANWVNADRNDLNFIGGVIGGTPRPACQAFGNPIRTAPFKNVTEVCDANGNLKSQWISNGVPMANDAIFFALKDNFLAQKLNDQNKLAFAELYAQSLTYEAYSEPTGFFAFELDNVFQNSYMSCVRTWADSIRLGVKQPPANVTCGGPGDQPIP